VANCEVLPPLSPLRKVEPRARSKFYKLQDFLSIGTRSSYSISDIAKRSLVLTRYWPHSDR